MGEIADTAEVAYGDFNVPGVPASGEKQVKKADARALFQLIDARILAIQEGERGFATRTDMDDPADGLLEPEGKIGDVLNDVVGTTVSRARTSNVATIVLAAPHGLAVGADVNVRSLGGTGYNGHVTATSGTTGSTLKFASTGLDESTTADTGGTVDRDGVYLKVGASGTGSWIWQRDDGVLAAIAQAVAALAAAATAQALADAADERALQANPRRGIAKPFIYGEKTADGYIQDFTTYDGRKDESLFLVKHRRGAHPTFVARDVTADGKLLSTLDYNGDLVDYFQRRYIDDFLESERFGWFGVLSAGTILVASGFPYELSVTLTWPSDGADISMTMAENDQLITWVDAV
jgi:hypothetical protein